jgi:putative hydrolase of the HAD superfamily
LTAPRQLPPVLLLDLDDTILDDSGARDACWRAACEEHAERAGVEAEALLREIERVRAEFWSDEERHRVWRQKMREATGRVATDALRALGVDDPELGASIGDRTFALRDAALAPLPGALEALERFRAAGTRLGLITNGGSEGQRAKIVRFALAGHFEYIGVEGEVGHGKPHRRAYEAALSALAAEPADAWMVGDNLVWDVAGAQAMGIRGIWLDRHGTGLPAGTDVVPDRVIRSIAELLPV